MSPLVSCWSLNESSTQSRAASRTSTRRRATTCRAERPNASATCRRSETLTAPLFMVVVLRSCMGEPSPLLLLLLPGTTARSTSGLPSASVAAAAAGCVVVVRISTNSSQLRPSSSATSGPISSSSDEKCCSWIARPTSDGASADSASMPMTDKQTKSPCSRMRPHLLWGACGILRRGCRGARLQAKEKTRTLKSASHLAETASRSSVSGIVPRHGSTCGARLCSRCGCWGGRRPFLDA